MDSDLIFYQFSRSKVEREDFSRFLSLYTPDRLPAGRRLREMMDCIVFCIEGYDDDPREIHSSSGDSLKREFVPTLCQSIASAARRTQTHNITNIGFS